MSTTHTRVYPARLVELNDMLVSRRKSVQSDLFKETDLKLIHVTDRALALGIAAMKKEDEERCAN